MKEHQPGEQQEDNTYQRRNILIYNCVLILPIPIISVPRIYLLCVAAAPHPDLGLSNYKRYSRPRNGYIFGKRQRLYSICLGEDYCICKRKSVHLSGSKHVVDILSSRITSLISCPYGYSTKEGRNSILTEARSSYNPRATNITKSESAG